MAEEQAAGCTRPTASTAADQEPQENVEQQIVAEKERKMIHVGERAPDFTAPGYRNGEFLDGVKLSDYAGKWVVLCFYPGDFTFV